MTKKQERELTNILSQLKKGKEYLLKKETGIFYFKELVGSKIPGNFYSESHPDIELEGPMEKQIGSPLCYLLNGIEQLESFLGLR